MSGLKPETRKHLLQVGVANIANTLLKRGFRNVIPHGVRPLNPRQPCLVGEAFTLRFIPAREDLDHMGAYNRDDNLHRVAIETCPAGKVLVIDALGSTAAASMGDMMAWRLVARGVAGVVSDGGFRDSESIRLTGLPCYAQGVAIPATPIRLHPVALEEPVGCGGVAVYPGDVIVGDVEGVAVIPATLVDAVAEEAFAATAYEEFAAEQIRAGRSLLGLFPSTPESRQEYEDWLQGKEHT
ncbi:MAG: ribonuclease activity regulator RraA [Zoogloeaceae bacterium]|jgi:regulator of RNase E activity RraA|nr:ribonuclease activity regulator RraA [Zoogloeaceae bacterium]